MVSCLQFLHIHISICTDRTDFSTLQFSVVFKLNPDLNGTLQLCKIASSMLKIIIIIIDIPKGWWLIQNSPKTVHLKLKIY